MISFLILLFLTFAPNAVFFFFFWVSIYLVIYFCLPQSIHINELTHAGMHIQFITETKACVYCKCTCPKCRHTKIHSHSYKTKKHAHMQSESEAETCTHTNPKLVFPACVRNDCQEAGVSHKPCSQETKADNQIETFYVSVCLSVCVCMSVEERERQGFFSCLLCEYK